MDTDNFIVYIKIEDTQTLQKMFKQNFKFQIMNQTDNYLKKKTQKIIEVMKNELGGKIMTEFAVLRPKTYSYLTDNKN